MFEMVLKGEADAAITNRFYGLMHAKKVGLEDTAVIFDPAELFFAASKNDPKQLLPAKKTKEPVPGTATVLVVEDDPSVRKLVCSILEHNGYRVIESTDPADAVDLAGKSQRPIDLVLTDVVMPGVNGPEVYRRICGHHPAARVLYMSGYTDDVITHRGMLKPGVYFAQKPFSVRTLTEKVREVLDQPHDG